VTSPVPEWRWLKFCIVGAGGMLVNVGVLYLGEQWLFTRVASGAVRLDCALATAIFSATLHNFLWNRRWTWRDRVTPFPQPAWAQFARYALACWLAIGLQFVLTRLLAASIQYLIANVLAILAASVCNFLAHDLWTFGRRRVGIAPVRGRSSGAG